jgi:Mn2+/Fe2+ NRAMP family transporter
LDLTCNLLIANFVAIPWQYMEFSLCIVTWGNCFIPKYEIQEILEMNNTAIY